MRQFKFNAYLFSFEKSRTLCGPIDTIIMQSVQCAHGTSSAGGEWHVFESLKGGQN